jgi:hypothetical protein
MGTKENVADKVGRARFGFLISDLEIAFTMTSLALNAHADSDKRSRNQHNARRAYDAVVRLSEKLDLTASEREQMDERLAQLKSALQELGESF